MNKEALEDRKQGIVHPRISLRQNWSRGKPSPKAKFTQARSCIRFSLSPRIRPSENALEIELVLVPSSPKLAQVR